MPGHLRGGARAYSSQPDFTVQGLESNCAQQVYQYGLMAPVRLAKRKGMRCTLQPASCLRGLIARNALSSLGG
jgi:hypothetical protein